MWKASAGHNVPQQNNADDDDWETDPDFVNDVTEEEQRWGSKTIEGSGRTAGAIDMDQLRLETEKADEDRKKKELEIKNPGLGYGGKFGIEKDRMDKCAVGHDYIGIVEKHGSQKDYTEGFGGKFGVQSDRVDKSAAGWDHKEKVEKHSSQKDYSTGFGGKFGVQNDRVDKSAVGWDHVEKVEKHESQKDYCKGFGGKFGVQEDRKDASAVGWDYVEKPNQHESQVDHKIGFGGKFGVQSDRMDKSAVSFQDNLEQTGTNYIKTKPDIGSAKPSNLRSRFENLAKAKEEEDQRKAAEQKRIREEKDRWDREMAQQQNKSSEANGVPIEKPQRKGIIDTGRSGGIGNAINRFNQPQEEPSIAFVQRKEPIKLPKEPIVEEPEPKSKNVPIEISVPPSVSVPIAAPVPPIPQEIEEPTQSVLVSQPDVIPAKHEQVPHLEIIETLPPPAEYDNINISQQSTTNEPTTAPEEQIYSNISCEQNVTALVGNENTDLAEYIEDTGLKALALYDYEATADDEISFDPNDIITHIEQIDEGWWRGLCKNRYGLFPANYVQLQ